MVLGLRCLRQPYMAPCLYLKNVVARGLSILKIISKRPPIGVMMQEHANAMIRHIITVYFLMVLS